MMMHSVPSNRVVWITGASSGIGLSIARILAASRNFVYVSARSEEKLRTLQEAFPEHVFPVPMDVTSADSIAGAERILRENTDHLDTLIICAGTCAYDDGPNINTHLCERLTRTNFLGATETVRIALPLLRKSINSPHIIGVSSLAALVPFPRASAYGASKAALEYFLQSLQVDVREDNIYVTVVRPGFVDTPLTQRNDFDMPFLMSSEEAAERIVNVMVRRQPFFEFPRKMSIPLKFMRYLPSFWMRSVAPKFRKPKVL